MGSNTTSRTRGQAGPGIPVSAGALIADRRGRLLILKPIYKKGWTIPGGVMEADGESPWQACRREVLEECGLVVTRGRLAAVDTRPARSRRTAQLRLLFDCGALDDAALGRIRLCRSEIGEHQILPPAEALPLLRPAIRRRVGAALLAAPACIYLEDGVPVPGMEAGGGGALTSTVTLPVAVALAH